MNQTKQQKRTAFTMSAKSMLSTLLLLIAMLVPQGAWAHYIEVTNGEGTSRYNFENNELTVTSVTEDEGDEDGYVTVTCTSPNDGQGYGTIIIPTFEYETTENTEFYNIEMLADDKVYITAVDNVVGGNPYIFKGSVTFSYKKDDLAPVVPCEFGNVRFTGTYEELTLHQVEGYYFNGEKFVIVSEDVTVNPFCCYIDGDGDGSLLSELSIVLDDEDDDEGEHEHNFEVSSCDWSEDYTTATLQLVCSRDEEHTANVEVTGEGITSEVTTPATCTTAGVRTYTAKATYEGETYTGTKEVEIPAGGHSFAEADTHHTHCTACNHWFIRYTTTDGEDLDAIDVRFQNAVKFGFDSETKSGYIEFANEVVEIGNPAFSLSENLETVILPSTVTNIGESAFSNCENLTDVSAEGVETISKGAFFSCVRLESATFPAATSIGEIAFQSCSGLTSVTFPQAIVIDSQAFFSCESLAEITSDDFPLVTTIGYEAFRDCPLVSISFPMAETVGSVFGGEKLTSVSLPEAKTIEGTFNQCTSLESIYLPKVETIGTLTFEGCTSLTTVDVPMATVFESSAFAGCKNLTTVNAPEVKSIGDYSFSGCTSLETLSFPKAESISSAFDGCTSLAELTVPCSANLTYAQVPEQTTVIQDHSFENHNRTTEPDEHGLYAYICDYGCGTKHVILNEDDSTTANIELTSTTVGGTTTYTAAAPVAVPDGAFSTPVDFTATGAQVSIDRTFAAATPATINLPFDVPASAMSETYYTFGGIEQNSEGKWVATMVPATGTLTANTPYIVLPTGTGISIGSSATVSFKADASANSTTISGDWTMTAAKADRIWAADDPELGKAYGFAASSGTAADGETAVEAGQFVMVAAGASIKAGRAYLKFNGTQFPSPSAAPTRATGAQLPASISVIFKHADATGIGTLNTETGAFTFDGWYDLQGRRISEPAKGGVIMNNNKKIIVK